MQSQTLWRQLRADSARWVLRVAIALSVILTGLYFIAEVTPLVREVQVIGLVLWLLAGVLHLMRMLRHRPRSRVPVAIMLLCALAWACLAGRPPDVEHLRGEYLRRLHAFRGTPYVWGGETHTGIDCSGLARTAMVEAMVVEGVREMNPRLLGPVLWQYWWNDVSARALGEGAFGYTRLVMRVPRLDYSTHAGILPGDLAVIHPRHVLIYLGERHWIEATSAHGVTVFTATPSLTRNYYHLPVNLVRWRMLDPTRMSLSQKCADRSRWP